MCRRLWRRRPSAREKDIEQWSHLNCLTARWTFKWRSWLYFCAKHRPHSLHWNGFSPMWTFIWRVSDVGQLNPLSQIWHMYLKCILRMFKCSFSKCLSTSTRVWNILLHTPHFHTGGKLRTCVPVEFTEKEIFLLVHDNNCYRLYSWSKIFMIWDDLLVQLSLINHKYVY